MKKPLNEHSAALAKKLAQAAALFARRTRGTQAAQMEVLRKNLQPLFDRLVYAITDVPDAAEKMVRSAEASMTIEFFDAVRSGDQERVFDCLDSGCNVDVRDIDGSWPHLSRDDSTPLMLACELGHWDIYCALREHKADINAKGKGGWTPLLCAIAGGHSRIAQSLLNAGCNAHARLNGGHRALDLAEENGLDEVAELIRQRLAISA